MRIDLAKVPTLWYENEDGQRHILTDEELRDCPKEPEAVKGEKPFVYQHSQFPNVLHHTILKIVQASEVAACEHPAERIGRKGGLIDGLEGRECSWCYGAQTRKTGEEWPDEWEAYGSRSIGTGTSSRPEDLVLAMASRPWWKFWRTRYSLGDAIFIAANSCERCLNALGYLYGMKWGYAEGSVEWLESGTRCQFCEVQ